MNSSTSQEPTMGKSTAVLLVSAVLYCSLGELYSKSFYNHQSSWLENQNTYPFRNFPSIQHNTPVRNHQSPVSRDFHHSHLQTSSPVSHYNDPFGRNFPFGPNYSPFGQNFPFGHSKPSLNMATSRVHYPSPSAGRYPDRVLPSPPAPTLTPFHNFHQKTLEFHNSLMQQLDQILGLGVGKESGVDQLVVQPVEVSVVVEHEYELDEDELFKLTQEVEEEVEEINARVQHVGEHLRNLFTSESGIISTLAKLFNLDVDLFKDDKLLAIKSNSNREQENGAINTGSHQSSNDGTEVEENRNEDETDKYKPVSNDEDAELEHNVTEYSEDEDWIPSQEEHLPEQYEDETREEESEEIYEDIDDEREDHHDRTDDYKYEVDVEWIPTEEEKTELTENVDLFEDEESATKKFSYLWTTENTAYEKSTENTASPMLTESTPFPMTTENTTTPLTTKKTPSPITTVITPSPITTENIPSILTTKKTPSPVTMPTENIPSPLTTVRTPSLMTTENIPYPMTIENTPSPKITENTPSPMTTENTPSPLTTENTPSPMTTENTPSPMTTENTPSPMTTENTPSPMTTENTPSPMTTENTPSPMTTENTSSPMTTENTPSPMTTEKIPSLMTMPTEKIPSQLKTVTLPTPIKTGNPFSPLNTDNFSATISSGKISEITEGLSNFVPVKHIENSSRTVEPETLKEAKLADIIEVLEQLAGFNLPETQIFKEAPVPEIISKLRTLNSSHDDTVNKFEDLPKPAALSAARIDENDDLVYNPRTQHV